MLETIIEQQEYKSKIYRLSDKDTDKMSAGVIIHYLKCVVYISTLKIFD